MSCDVVCHDGSVLYKVFYTENIFDPAYDGIVVVNNGLENLPEEIKDVLNPLLEVDKSFLSDGGIVRVDLPCRRVVFSPTGPLNRDYDDVRRWSDAASSGIQRALKAGCKAPLLVCGPDTTYEHSSLVTVLGALSALYVPLEIREDVPDKAVKAQLLGVWCKLKPEMKFAVGIENGRLVCRDIIGSDPERLCPSRVEEYVHKLFSKTCIKVSVIKGQETFVKDYPLFAAVNRGSEEVERYKGRIINLEYTGEGNVTETLMLVGKGVTYDTGGHDLKAGGNMAGMHRDKGGAAVVAGFFKILAELKPKNIKVIGALCVVRNAIGPNAYVADEIITSRAGVRVRIGNTDAEGRMIMADVLCKMKERATKEVKPHLMTVATLTGHALLCYGDHYTAVMDNRAAGKEKCAQAIQDAGDVMGDMLEVSTIRREDYEFNKGKSEYEDVMQSNSLPSTRTPRGHQLPAAFLILASGLDKHGIDSQNSLKYTHIDISGCAEYPDMPTASPVAALAYKFIYNRL